MDSNTIQGYNIPYNVMPQKPKKIPAEMDGLRSLKDNTIVCFFSVLLLFYFEEAQESAHIAGFRTTGLHS